MIASTALDAALTDGSTGIAAQLTAIETADSLTPNSLERPSAYIRTMIPTEYRKSVCMAVVNGVIEEDACNQIADVQCLIGFAFAGAAGDANMEAAEDLGWYYCRAARMMMSANDRTLGHANVIEAYASSSDRDFGIDQDNNMYHARALSVIVRVNDS